MPPVAQASQSIAERQIARAKLLEKQRAALMKEITANRDFLRLLDDNEELSDAQGEWLEDFYPQKERGATRSKEEIERTRKAKEEARTDGAS